MPENEEEGTERVMIFPSATQDNPKNDQQTLSVEKEPLIEEGDGEEPKTTYWKGSEFLNSSHLCSSKLSLHSCSTPICKICHTSSNTRFNPLISPCRCTGTLLFVHKACVVRWLEMSTRKMVPSPKCELCGYDYKRSSIFRIRSIHIPHVDRVSSLLNILCLLTLLIMLVSGYTGMHFLQQNAAMRQKPAFITHSTYPWKRRGFSGREIEMTNSEETFLNRPVASLFDKRVTSCVVIFVCAFLVALFTQYRAECTIFRCIFRFFIINKNWLIEDYNIARDPEIQAARQALSTVSK